MNESRLIFAIMQALGKVGAVFRTNAGQFYTKDGKRVSGLPKGFSDIVAVLPGGRVAFIEVKTDKGKPSPEQTQFIAKMQGLGASAGIARNVPEALAICGILAGEGVIVREQVI
ncbi:MAG: VRR-NUC domain-containing protein [Defluviitaleaceae bacterium]|nr:VRR-NUC domain-containing protein [Defluviitaleaceae bacterium]